MSGRVFHCMMKTYISVFFSTEGAKPSKVLDALNNLGFEPTTGNFDCEKVWGTPRNDAPGVFLEMPTGRASHMPAR